jgi:hypothetical protein
VPAALAFLDIFENAVTNCEILRTRRHASRSAEPSLLAKPPPLSRFVRPRIRFRRPRQRPLPLWSQLVARAEAAQAHFSRPAHATPATSANRQSGFTLGVSIRTGRPRAGLGRQPATARDGNRPLFRTGTCAQDVTLGSRRTACRGRRPFGQAPRQRIAILI